MKDGDNKELPPVVLTTSWSKSYAERFKTIAEAQIESNRTALEQFHIYTDYEEFQTEVLNNPNLSVASKLTIECLYTNIRSGNLKALEVWNQIALNYCSKDEKGHADGLTKEERSLVENNINRIKNEIEQRGNIGEPIRSKEARKEQEQ